jgi:hypothetical protein
MENFEIAMYVIVAIGSLNTIAAMQEYTKGFWRGVKECEAVLDVYPDIKQDYQAERKRDLLKGQCVWFPLIILTSTFFMSLAAFGAYLIFV